VARAGVEETRRAVDEAERAMRDPMPAHARAAVLERVATRVFERREDIARTICAEAGKPLKAARIEAARAASTYTLAAVEARKLAGEVVPMDASESGSASLRSRFAARSASSARLTVAGGNGFRDNPDPAQPPPWESQVPGGT
jgi:acyl-CoA reductase-like NAD-dependent aldehyde dehydrogenase